MRIRLAPLLIATLSAAVLSAQSSGTRTDEQRAIERTIQRYFDGWAVGDSGLLGSALHPSAHLKRSLDDKFVDMDRATYVGGMRLHGRDSTLATRIASLDIVGPIAQARAEISIGEFTFVDFFNLLKVDGGWTIVDKVSTRIPRARVAPSPPDQAALPVRPVLDTVASGLRRPWSIAFLSDDEALVSEKEGQLLRLDLRTGRARPIHGFPRDMADSVGAFGAGDNTGKFDVVVDPAFATTGQLFLAYAATNGRGRTTKVVRARLSGDSLTGIRPIFVAEPFTADRHHYGGGLTIGRDGMLYLSVGGRLFSEADEPRPPISQDRRDRRGKIFRFRTDGTIPSDNPDFGPGSVPGLFALGIRNTQGLTVHPVTGEIWFTDHGTHQGDEVNVLRRGANYGWPLRTTGRYRDTTFVPPATSDSLTDPVWSWPHTVSPTGLVFYTGAEFPSWRESLLVGGLSRGSLWRLTVRGPQVVAAEELFVDHRMRLRKVAQSPSGTLYLLTDRLDGQLLRVRNAARPSGATASGQQGTAPPQRCDADVTAVLDARVPGWLTQHGVPSLAIGYVANGAVQWTRVYGEARPGVAASTRTAYNVASLTKPVFAELVTRLAAAGRISLTEPVSRSWVDPDLATDPRRDSLTLALLLSHRAGLPNWRYQTDGRLRFIAPIGDGFHYSGEGFEYAARAVERRTGRSLDALADELLGAPLGVRELSFTRQPWVADQAAHARDGEGRWIAPTFSATGNAADELYATIGGYTRFLLAAASREGLPASWRVRRDSMFTVDPNGAQQCASAVVARCPTSAGYGLGWSLLTFGATATAPAEHVVWHTGIDRAERAMAVWLPERQRGLVMLSNGANGFLPMIEAGVVALCGSPFTGVLESGRPRPS